jgi:hypothetical protein
MAYTTINKGSSYFNTKLYTGNGSTQSVTGVGFQPDWVWIKNRSTTTAPVVYDAVRGATKDLYTSATDAEGTNANGVTSFNSDGFSVGSSGGVNGNTQNIVAWNWLGANTTASNTSGTISSTVSANTTAGFSIVSYTGTATNATVGHGLGAVPRMIIVKNRNTTNSWEVYHASLGATKVILLNRDEAEQTSASSWNNTAPTSTLFSIGTGTGVNGNTNPIIAYCFAEVKGFSKFGSYTGNGNANGTFIYTGFKPAFVLRKRTDTTGSWILQDNKRTGINQAINYTSVLYANDSSVETIYNEIDIISNGFKIRASDTFGNASGGTYIYAAFAENPFVTSGGIPVTAR